MSERPPLNPIADLENVEIKERFIKGVVFERRVKPGGQLEFKSSAHDRKIMILSENSVKPQPGEKCRVRVVEDTDPDDPMKGKVIVEVVGIGAEAVEEGEYSISYLGVELEKAKDRSGPFVPNPDHYADYINDPEISLPLQRDLAVAWLSGEPILVDGGTSLGKTTTVKKMCAELGYEVHYANLNGATDVEDLMGRYIPNANKSSAEDPEYIFADGKVTKGLRQEEGKMKVIILDEFNSAKPDILIRLHEVLDALERGGEVVLAEDASEAVPTDKTTTKVVALMNPPGKGYIGREPLDPAQLRRWVYKKMPAELPASTFQEATNVLFGLKPEPNSARAAAEKVKKLALPSREQALQFDQLKDIPGLPEITRKYQEFHAAAKALVKHRQVAADQPQPFSYDDRMEPRRVRDFILRFYRGDINETMQNAIRYYYLNKIESDVDRAKMEEMVKLVEHKPGPAAPSGRRPLGR